MTISVTYPYNFVNGTIADANQVDANFAAINSGGFAQCAANGANSDITSILGLTTPLSRSQGGTGTTTGNGLVPSGVVMAWAGGSTAPTGWLLCDGSAISRTIYTALFAVCGTVYGAGDGSTTFNLPDLRARTVAGADVGNVTGRMPGGVTGGVGAGAHGNAGGTQSHTLTTAELAAHNHGVNDSGHAHGVNDPTHNHNITQSPHAHAPPSITDTGHAHSASDAGHTHSIYGSNSPAGSGGILQNSTTANQDALHGTTVGYASITVAAAATGISLSATGMSGANVANVANSTGIGIALAATGVTTQSVGSGTALNIVQPTLIMNWIIKT
jgi:microcystin-dependent protein